ncbi:hypothetical protein [Devosia sp.]|uniref:AbiU2 domain-containing protein n=1 Tax=Devosia sp. TaxID=1871048 RepID=UPI0025F074C4|nr:hypothetical protein [Devosia sp.]MCR6634738.1 hypothetical protein [Devosia sp.]
MGKQADAALAARLADWKSAFKDEVTGIQTIMDDMLWDYAAFRTAISIVYLANQRQRANNPQDDAATLNQMLFNLLAKGYWSSLLLGARKLLDDGPIRGPRGVNSLRAILSDIKAVQPKLTRRVYVEKLRMARYDLEKLQQVNWETLKAANGMPIWGDPALMQSDFAHRDFDYLSGVKPADRTELDLIDPMVFDLFESRLAQLDEISEHTSTHIAHAGNAESRLGKGLEQFDMRDAREVLKALKELSDRIGLWFADSGVATLAVYQGDQFEALDLPAVASIDLPELEANWGIIDQDIDSWTLSPEELLTGG